MMRQIAGAFAEYNRSAGLAGSGGKRQIWWNIAINLPLRLFRRDCGRWNGLVHETVDIKGSVGHLRHVLKHRTLADVRFFLSKIDHYTSLEACEEARIHGGR